MKYRILCILLLIPLLLLSQEEESTYLLRDSKVTLSSFYAQIAPSTSFSKLNDQNATVVDVSGGLILNNRFTVAFFFSGSPKINKLAIPEFGSEDYWDWIEAGVELEDVASDAEFLFVKFRHGGFNFGYQHYSGKPVFWKTNLGIGFLGGLDLTEDKTFFGLFDNPVYKRKIFTLEPSVGVGINMLKWWRINADIGYRWISTDPRVIKNADADSFTFKLSFGFGNFSYK
jgi:hypothetical protein